MFCSNCGSQNGGAASFCSSCGSAMAAVNVESTAVGMAKKPKRITGEKKILGLKPLVFGIALGGSALAAVVAVLLVVLMNKPLPTSQTAGSFMLTYKDVSAFNLQSDSKPIDQISTTSAFIYGDCSAKTDLKNASKTGVSLGKNGFTSPEDASDFWISSQIIQFPSEDDAKVVLSALEDGAADPECDSPNISDYYSGGEALSKTYGVSVDGTSLVDEWDTTEDQRNILVVARRGNVLLYVQTHNIETSGVSDGEVSTMITLALNKFKG